MGILGGILGLEIIKMVQRLHRVFIFTLLNLRKKKNIVSIPMTQMEIFKEVKRMIIIQIINTI